MLISRKLPMQTLQKLHLSNRLYIEQISCHLLMLLLSVRACSRNGKRNIVCSKIPFSRSSSLLETNELICIANQLTGFCVMRDFVARGFCLISGRGSFLWTHGFLQILGRITREFVTMCFGEGFLVGECWVGFLFFLRCNF